MRRLQVFRSFTLVVATCCFAIASFAALTAYVLLSDRSGREERARTANFNVAQGLASEVSRTLELYDLSLRGAIEALHDPDFNNLSPGAQQTFLFDRAATATYLYSILILDETGRARYDSLQVPARALDASGSDYFTAHQKDASLGLYVSKPILSRLTREWMVILSRRYNNPDGSFAGVVVGSLSLQYFSTLFDRVVLGPESAISLFRQDGTLIMRRPYRYPLIGKFLPGSAVFERYPHQHAGWFDSQGLDGLARKFAFAAVSNLPMVITVGMTEAEILGDWPQKSMLLGLAVLGFSGAMVALMLLLARAQRRQRRAEEELARLAETDPLTGLANRRLLTRSLAEAWSRCGALGQPVTVLMIDVDHFKAYNDHRGHGAGDEALCAVAARVVACCDGPGQLVARYGGEEFVVLLPEADLDAAQALAQRISRSVEASRMAHPAAPAGVLTVSIGVSTAWPRDDLPDTLMKAADAALYEAKRRGRNCVWSASGAKAA